MIKILYSILTTALTTMIGVIIGVIFTGYCFSFIPRNKSEVSQNIEEILYGTDIPHEFKTGFLKQVGNKQIGITITLNPTQYGLLSRSSDTED